LSAAKFGGSKGRGIIENVYERLEFMPRESKEKLVIENGIMGGMGSFDDTSRIASTSSSSRSAPVKTSSLRRRRLESAGSIEAAIRSHENGTVEEVPQQVKRKARGGREEPGYNIRICYEYAQQMRTDCSRKPLRPLR
jgi:hypothetical protein